MSKLRLVLPILLVAVLIAACDGGSNSGDNGQAAIDRGLAAYKAKRYAAAYREWLPVAETGNAEAQYLVGRLFDRGKGVKKDDAAANSWYRKAAEQGYAKAQYGLALQLNYGYGVAKSADQALQMKEAARWFQAAAEQGYAKAQGWLGYYYRQGTAVPKSGAESVKWLKKGAAQGDKFSLYLLAEHQSNDSNNGSAGVPLDDDAAVQGYLKAANKGDYWSAQNLERLFNEGRTSLSAADIVQLFEKLARRASNSPAQAHLARIYLEGRLTERDPTKAAPLLERGAKYGFTRHYASYQLARLYLAGDGVPRNTAKAADLLERTAERTPKARLILAFLHANGDGVAQDFAQAYYWASLAAHAPRDRDTSERALQARFYFESRMSPEDKLKGRRLLQERLATLAESRRQSEERQVKKLEEKFVPANVAMGREGLDQLIASGKLRHAAPQEIQTWLANAGETIGSKASGLTHIPIDRVYVVSRHIVLPDGLIGSQAVTFLLAADAPAPTGPRGDNLFYSMTDFKCHPRCGLPDVSGLQK